MTNQQKQQIIKMRDEGLGYGIIAKELNLSKSTVSTLCKKLENGATYCLECGKKLVQIENHKKRKYCSDQCRKSYLRKHGNNNKKMTLEIECQCCHKTFKTFKSLNRKYCSWDCYLEKRYKGGESDEGK